jgi:hypothetical protein
VTARRTLGLVAVLIAAASIWYAVKPFKLMPNATAAEGVANNDPAASGSSGLHSFSIPIGSCRAPVLDAWRGKGPNWTATFDVEGAGPLPKHVTVGGNSCRGVARERLATSLVGLLIGALCIVLRTRRPRLGGGPESDA